jgi:hypothetical protein
MLCPMFPEWCRPRLPHRHSAMCVFPEWCQMFPEWFQLFPEWCQMFLEWTRLPHRHSALCVGLGICVLFVDLLHNAKGLRFHKCCVQCSLNGVDCSLNDVKHSLKCVKCSLNGVRWSVRWRPKHKHHHTCLSTGMENWIQYVFSMLPIYFGTYIMVSIVPWMLSNVLLNVLNSPWMESKWSVRWRPKHKHHHTGLSTGIQNWIQYAFSMLRLYSGTGIENWTQYVCFIFWLENWTQYACHNLAWELNTVCTPNIGMRTEHKVCAIFGMRTERSMHAWCSPYILASELRTEHSMHTIFWQHISPARVGTCSTRKGLRTLKFSGKGKQCCLCYVLYFCAILTKITLIIIHIVRSIQCTIQFTIFSYIRPI